MDTRPFPTAEERAEQGKALRKRTPRSSHADWSADSGRPDPVSLLEEQNLHRLDWLVPVRRGRMMRSPFTFFRGGARVMATDLARTPTTGLAVQACGDAHLANFGLFGSPERELVFDLNDFDETLAGPWEWDVKRLAVSFTIAARHNGLDAADAVDVTQRAVRSYREGMADLAGKRHTEVFYALLEAHEIVRMAKEEGLKKQAVELEKKAQTKDSLQALGKFAEEVGGDYRLKCQPPVLVPLRELRDRLPGESLRSLVLAEFEQYASTVSHDCKRLLDRYRPVDIALKVVGVGSVGTRCFILLLEGRDRQDPLFLQIKQATGSVLAEHLAPSPYEHQGRRVVEGQRLMQAASDAFLGWGRSPAGKHHYYWRQLRDWKGSVDVEDIGAANLRFYARLCGWTLARAHARSGDPIAIAGYLGSNETFDKALVEFSERYADQNERDHAVFVEEIRAGRLEAEDA